MEDGAKKESIGRKVSYTSTNTKSVWMAGGAVIVLVTLFCLAMFKTTDNSWPVQDAGQGGMGFSGGGQQVAFANPNCATCPSVAQCFPQGTGSAQQVAFTNPNCATCPSFTQCFPQGTTGAQQAAYTPGCAQQVAFGRPVCPIGSQQRGMGRMLMGGQANGGYKNIAFTQTTPAPIFRDAVMPHEYRGVCENCHIVKPDISIQATAQMPHEYRGVCSNCHVILGLNSRAQ
ncbi:MAG: magnetochrome domain-containing protein [Candidatus Omnitrophica bacterium]|nr:magnetochrome domain-containing protein [Candidatus Omnitrophota bacterium]